MAKGTKGDIYTKEILQRILDEGCLDNDPRPHYIDGTPAHTLSYNHGMCTYDLTKGESPLITLRPIATKSAIGELLWIYQDESNDLNVLRDKYGVTWWDEWDIGNRTIGSVYGETVRRHELVKRLIEGLKNNPDGRRHIISLWQEDDFKDKHGLKPCAFMTQWNIRHGKDGVDYLDMCLTQRSSDFCTAGCINQVQYLVFLHLIARHLNLVPGRFTWFYNNIQIYDRHIEQAKELIAREPVDCQPYIWLNPDKTNFYDFAPEDIEVRGYPREEIKEKNPQMKFEIGV
ncbi:MAG: thymidylate synthase [Bacilli bacterium]|nr:thymidylate synthase [Bacilli bacterium]